MFRKILFPTDFSLHANKVLECIPDLKRVGIEEVVLVHNINPMKAARWIDIDEKRIERIKGQAEEKMKQIIDQILSEHGINGKYTIRVGVTYQEILEVAKKERVSLLLWDLTGRVS